VIIGENWRYCSDAELPGNSPMLGRHGHALTSLAAINRWIHRKRSDLCRSVAGRLLQLLQLDPGTLCIPAEERLVEIIAPDGLSFARIEVRAPPEDTDVVFFC